eukprot:3511829-Pyramimonas_sp.AAC.1
MFYAGCYNSANSSRRSVRHVGTISSGMSLRGIRENFSMSGHVKFLETDHEDFTNMYGFGEPYRVEPNPKEKPNKQPRGPSGRKQVAPARGSVTPIEE